MFRLRSELLIRSSFPLRVSELRTAADPFNPPLGVLSHTHTHTSSVTFWRALLEENSIIQKESHKCNPGFLKTPFELMGEKTPTRLDCKHMGGITIETIWTSWFPQLQMRNLLWNMTQIYRSSAETFLTSLLNSGSWWQTSSWGYVRMTVSGYPIKHNALNVMMCLQETKYIDGVLIT